VATEHEAGEPGLEQVERAIDLEAERATGPIAAVMVAAGVGALALGILTTLNEASESLNSFLRFSDRVGPLSGKTIIAGAVFFGVWGLLAGIWRRSNPPLRAAAVVSVVLIVLGLVGTFPIFFEAFAD
jgi:hypothetical protein